MVIIREGIAAYPFEGIGSVTASIGLASLGPDSDATLRAAVAGGKGWQLGRMAALDAGYDIRAGGVTLNRFCGSSITSTNFAAAMIKARS